MVPRAPDVGFSHGWLAPASSRPRACRRADFAIAQSTGDIDGAVPPDRESEPVTVVSGLVAFSERATFSVLSSPLKRPGMEELQPAAARAKKTTVKEPSAPKP